MKLFHSPAVQALNGIKQLGPAYLVYPGAVHTRLNHSLGVYHTAREMLLHLLQDRAEGTAAGHQKVPVFTLRGARAFLAAALLHDIGHFPFAHSLKELPLKEHEQLGAEMLLADSQTVQIIREDAGTDPEMVADIIDEQRVTTDPETAVYRRMLSGPLDPDKIDYLHRDAYFCGVPYGSQDISYIISKLCWSEESESLTVEASASGALENLLFSKYLMYKYVYWHKRVRSATAMVKKALYHALKEEILSPDDLYGLDDDQFFQLTEKRSFPFSSYIPQVKKNLLFDAALEIPFDRTSEEHRKLADLEYRSGQEKLLSSQLLPAGTPSGTAFSVIIDIPEPVSFDFFSEASAPLLSREMVSSLQNSLRMIRLFVPPGLQIDADAAREALSGSTSDTSRYNKRKASEP